MKKVRPVSFKNLVDFSNEELRAFKKIEREYQAKLRQTTEREFQSQNNGAFCCTTKSPTIDDMQAAIDECRAVMESYPRASFDRLALTAAQYEQLKRAIDKTNPCDVKMSRIDTFYGFPIEVYDTEAALHQRMRQALHDRGPRLGVIRTDEIDRLFPQPSLFDFPFLSKPMRCSMSDEEKTLANSATAAVVDIIAVETGDSGNPTQTAVPAVDPNEQGADSLPAIAEQVEQAQDNLEAQGETPAADEAADSGTTDVPPEAAAVETQSGVTEEIAEVEPVAFQGITLERAQSVPIDDPEGYGNLNRVAYALQRATDPAKPITSLFTTAKLINTQGRLDMIASLTGRLLRHPKAFQPTMMAEAIGDVTIGDELERFAREGFTLPALVNLCEYLVPCVQRLA